MKASMFLLGASAILASAGPIRAPIEKRALETEWVYEIVTVTVTAGDEPAPEPTHVVFLEEPAEPEPEPTTVVEKPASRRPKKVVAKPSSTKAAEQPKTTIVYEAPKSTLQPAPEPEPTKEPEPEPEPVQEEPAPTADSGSDSSAPDLNLDADYESVMLAYHNIHRLNHSAPALAWDDTLAGYALNTANTCIFEHDMEQGGGGYGQNLASWGSTTDIDSLKNKAAAGGITNQWYNNEMANWSFYGQDNPPEGMDILLYGHFTQVVWKKSTKVGCATVKCASGTLFDFPAWYTVCNYNPQGNFGGQYGDNVLQPKGEKRVTV
ncbi:hypothetical protein ACJ41O_008683 [Fusarium nematophilum]